MGKTLRPQCWKISQGMVDSCFVYSCLCFSLCLKQLFHHLTSHPPIYLFTIPIPPLISLVTLSSTYLPIHPLTHPHPHPFIYLPTIHPFIDSSIHTSIYPPIYLLSTHPSIHSSTSAPSPFTYSLSIYQTIYSSVTYPPMHTPTHPNSHSPTYLFSILA